MKLGNEYKHISHDEADTCANYAKFTKLGNVKIMTVYRFGKTSYREVSFDTFTSLIKQNKL